jgi:hypothetical protein
MSQMGWMGATAHEAIADLAQGLPRRVSSPAKKLKGARSDPAAQPREGSVLSGSGRADPSCGGPGSRPGTVRSPTTADGLEELPECRRHLLEVLRQSNEEGIVTTAHVLAGFMAQAPPNCCKSRACSRLRATQNLKKGFTCTPANP